MKRVFVAIDISDEARRIVAARISAFRNDASSSAIKWIRPDNLHLTLQFVGDVDNGQLQPVVNSVKKISEQFRKFRLSLQGVGAFPSPSKARVLWIGIHDEDSNCVKIKESLEHEFRQLGIAGDRKPVTPHLTVARIKDPRAARPLIEKYLNTEFEPIDFDVAKIVTYESKLLPTGSIYSKIATLALDPNG